MNLHANAALSLKGRRELCLAVVERERTLAQAAEAAGVSVRCARKWVGRYRAEGESGLRDRSSAPHRIPHRTSEQRVAGDRGAAGGCGSPARRSPRSSTCRSRPCRGSCPGGMGKLGRLGLEPPVRYERERPGELIHIDIKRLGQIERGAGARITGMATRGSGHRKDALGVHARPQAGSACTSRLMTALAWPTPRSSPIRTGAPSSDFSDALSRSTPATASPSSGS